MQCSSVECKVCVERSGMLGFLIIYNINSRTIYNYIQYNYIQYTVNIGLLKLDVRISLFSLFGIAQRGMRKVELRKLDVR